jgi:hypothetical protein
MKEASSFWESVPLEELVEQQRVSAVEDLDEIAALWPADDDPDVLLRYLLGERIERRKRSKSRGSAR